MKILLVSPLPPPEGGIATWTKHFERYCHTSGIHLDIVNSALTGKRSKKINDKTSIKDEIKRTLYIFGRIRHFITKEKYDVIHFNSSCSKLGILRDALLIGFARRFKTPIVFECHCNLKSHIQSSLSLKAFNYISKRSKEVWVINQGSLEFAKAHTQKAKYMPNFIDEDALVKEKEIREEISKALFVGHVQKDKGFLEITEIAAKLSNIEFVIAGPVSPEVSSVVIPQNMNMLGNVEHKNIKALMSDSDVFLFPSHAEGFSLVMLEAMASGLPIIATDVGANKEMISCHGGIIVNVGDTSAMEDAFSKISLPEIRQEMSVYNIKRITECYTVEKVLHQIIEEYRKMGKECFQAN